MTDQQHPDDTDITQRHEVPAEPPAWPATAGTTTTPATPATGDPLSAVERYSPPLSREPTGRGTRAASSRPRHPSGGTSRPSCRGPSRRRRSSPPQATPAVRARRPRHSPGRVHPVRRAGLERDGPGSARERHAGSTRTGPGRPDRYHGRRHQSADHRSSATIDVAAAVSPAVVRITTGGDVDTSTGMIPETGVGSGVIYDGAGWILTNRHVVEGSDSLAVELNDGRVLDGTVYGIDTLTDLAIVKVEGNGLPTASLGDSSALKVGQLVIAIGSPLGTYSNSVTSGIVSAKGRTITADGNDNLNNLIQTDAAINPGNWVARCWTRAATSSGSTPPSRRTATASASRSPSTSPGRSWSRPWRARSWPGPTWASSTERSTSSTRRRTTCRSPMGRSSSPGTPRWPDAGRRSRQPGGSGRPARGRHHRQGQHPADRRRPPVGRDAERVRPRRYDLRGSPA